MKSHARSAMNEIEMKIDELAFGSASEFAEGGGTGMDGCWKEIIVGKFMFSFILLVIKNIVQQ